jgi:predicted O-methyltransferase YrrM
MSKTFSVNWVAHVEAQWREHLTPLAGKPDLRFVEVGSYEGRSACWWLDNILTHPTARLTCIDPWTRHPVAETRFDGNTKGYGGKIEKRKAESRHELPKLADSSLDFAYIDGCHEAGPTMLDAINAFHKLKTGALMFFDDYAHQGPWLEKIHHLPGEGIDAFLRLYDHRLELLFKGWQVGVRKVW